MKWKRCVCLSVIDKNSVQSSCCEPWTYLGGDRLCVYFVCLSVVCLQREEMMARHFLKTSFVRFFWIFTSLGLTRPPTPCSLPSSTWWITHMYRVCLHLCHLSLPALLTVCKPVTPPDWIVNNNWLLFVQRFVILSGLSLEQPWLYIKHKCHAKIDPLFQLITNTCKTNDIPSGWYFVFGQMQLFFWQLPPLCPQHLKTNICTFYF